MTYEPWFTNKIEHLSDRQYHWVRRLFFVAVYGPFIATGIVVLMIACVIVVGLL